MADGVSWRCFHTFMDLDSAIYLAVNGTDTSLPVFIQNILNCVLKTNEAFTGSERHGGKWKMVEYPFKTFKVKVCVRDRETKIRSCISSLSAWAGKVNFTICEVIWQLCFPPPSSLSSHRWMTDSLLSFSHQHTDGRSTKHELLLTQTHFCLEKS